MPGTVVPRTALKSVRERIGAVDEAVLEGALLQDGYARVPGLLDADSCEAMIALYDQPRLFRQRIEMARHAYGVGEYQYFARPLPELVQLLREELYARLSPIANRMLQAIGRPTRYPVRLEEFLERCHQAGQQRPTALMLRYRAGGENRLHRDLYGPLAFPLQAVVQLSREGRDFEGGEFLLLEQRARQQSRAEAIALRSGELLIFPGFERPARGRRGPVIASMRHGVSRVRRGERYALGIIFHDGA